MEVRDFLPGEPAVGDVVVCWDASWSPRVRLQRMEVPRKGQVYRVRRTQVCLDAEWGDHDIMQLTPHPSMNAFHPYVRGWWSSLYFKAVATSQHERPEHARSKIVKPETASDGPVGDDPRRRLWYARQCGAWRQLCGSNFGLGLALAVLNPSPCEAPASWQDGLAEAACQRRLAICRLLGFPASASSLQVLSRLHHTWGQAFDTTQAEWMLTVLRHLLVQDAGASALLQRHRLISRADVSQLAFGTNNTSLSHLFADELEIRCATWFFRLPAAQRHWLIAEFEKVEAREGETAGVVILPRARRLGGFQREKDAVAYLRNRQRSLDILSAWGCRAFATGQDGPWPEPPLPGSDTIQPIIGMEELLSESAELKHCISAYADHIALGVYFAYRMTGPTRCTIGLRWCGTRWNLDQIRARANGRIDQSQHKAVLEWMDSHSALGCSLRSEVASEVCRLIRLPKRPRPFHALTARGQESAAQQANPD